MPWYTVGGLLIVTGGALMYTVDQNTSTARVYGYSVLIGFGDGLFAQASFSVAQAIVDPDLIASAVGFITCAQGERSPSSHYLPDCSNTFERLAEEPLK
jgi:hypothetical protein